MNAGDAQHRPHAGTLREVSRIFAEAIEKPTADRDEFVLRACAGDEGLRAEVGTLLAAFPKGEALLEASALHDKMRAAAAVATQSEERSGQLLSHYRLEELIGAGGMGEVYRAKDVALGRTAAVKLLRSGVDAQLRSRLLLEAKTSARLEHPAIAAFFESGTAEGIDFLAMEYVQGETLRARLERGPLAPAKALSMVATLLEALVHSHAAGIVHRDIKPENIMLTPGGGAKLLDFGIAKEFGKEVAEEGIAKTTILRTSLTSHGMIVGTIGYMSPEQLRGDPINESTDVFAMGAVLYEALTGGPAFPGETSSQRIASVLSRDIPPVGIQGLDPDIDTILRRALARDSSDRYPNASTFLHELRRFATGEAVAVLPDTIAILDLENVTKRADDDWIGSGIAESLGADLGRIEGITLVPRGKVLKTRAALVAQGEGLDPAEIGLAIGCRWVVTGSFQSMGPALRLNVRLVEVATGKDVWTEKIDGKLDDIFDMQDRLAALTAASLNLVLPERKEATTESVDAFELVAKAQQIWWSLERSALQQAQEYLEQALEINPHNAVALSMLASMYAPLRWLQTDDPAHLETSLQYSLKAIEANPHLAEAHNWVGYVYWRQGRFEEALRALDRAASLNAAEMLPPYFKGCCLFEILRIEEAILSFQRALSIEPRATFVLLSLGAAHMELGDLQTALWTLERALESERDPHGFGWGGVGIILAECLRRAGRLEEARAQCMDTLGFLESGDSVHRSLGRPAALNELGRIALDQGDLEAARVAFAQAEGAIRAQPRGNKGHTLVQVLAGRARAGEGPQFFEEAKRVLFGGEFGFNWGAGNNLRSVDFFQLARAAEALGRRDEAQEFLEQARTAGSIEAQEYELSIEPHGVGDP